MSIASSRRARGSVAALLLLGPAVAHAGGFTSARFGGEYATPTADQPTAIYYNPAALALGRGTRVYLEGLAVYRTASYDRPADAIDNPVASDEAAAGTPRDAIGANAGKNTLANALVSPFVGVASDLGVEDLGVGLAFFVPFGGQSKWDTVDNEFSDDPRYPGAIDGSQRWATIEGELRALYLSAAGAYRIPSADLSFGASVSLVHQEIDTVRARTAAGTDDLVAGDDIIEGRSRIAVAGNSLAIGLGVLWRPLEALRVGASYQSQPGFGETAQRGTLTNQFGAGAPNESEIEVLQSLPDVVRLGAAYRLSPRVEARLSLDYQRWSVLEGQCLVDSTNPDRNCDLNDDGSLGPDAVGVVVNIPRHWKDTYGVRAGASYWLSPAFELLGGASFDSAAVPDRYLEPSLSDMNKVVVGAGLRYALLGGDLWLNLMLNNAFYVERTIAPRERDADGNSDGFVAPSRVPDFAGTYTVNTFFANLAAEYRF